LGGDDFCAATEPAERATERDVKVEGEVAIFRICLGGKRSLIRFIGKMRCGGVGGITWARLVILPDEIEVWDEHFVFKF
jgi:hypothetical protein